MGRRIEELMLYAIVKHARSLPCHKLTARLLPTAKNKPCLMFWQGSGFRSDTDDTTFVWSLEEEFRAPGFIDIVTSDSDTGE